MPSPPIGIRGVQRRNEGDGERGMADGEDLLAQALLKVAPQPSQPGSAIPTPPVQMQVSKEKRKRKRRRTKVVDRSYAVVVKGAAGAPLTADEIKEKVLKDVGDNIDVRVSVVRKLRDGVAIETRSAEEVGRLKECGGFARSGLRVEDPKGVRPKMLVYDVKTRKSFWRRLSGKT